ncbi:MAG: hypothetical protein JWM34_1848 [Ilumatobacteraceae bacterium]|nr:hypothetical protein [Ilumatobacteraceae bacterium]
MPTVRRVVTGLIVMTSLIALAGCSGTDLAVPRPDTIPIPTFETKPDDLARSPQLLALVGRDTAGIPVNGDPAAVGLLTQALQTLQASADKPTELTRVAIDDEFVDFTYEQGGITGRSVTASYRAGEDLTVSDPAYVTDPTFAIASIDSSVPAAVVAAIAAHVPDASVTRVELSATSSYGFGLVWNFDVEDGRGQLATVFADLDGSIVAVDESD